MSTTYRAAVVRTPAGADSIELTALPVRRPGAGEVRVRIEAAAVNPVDLGVAGGYFHSLGLVHQPDHTGLGWDFSGSVIETGAPDLSVALPVGTRVAGIVPGFDRDFGAYAEEIVVPLEWLARVPEGLATVAAATVPLNALTGSQIVDLLGEPAGRLLVTGAAGAVGAYVAQLAAERGWDVTGLARAEDEEFVRGLGVAFTTEPTGGWDAVADGAVLQEAGVALVRDGGVFVGVQPGAQPAAERGITVRAVDVTPDATRLAVLLERTARGELPVRIHAEIPLSEVADAHRVVAKGGVRGRFVLIP